MLPTYSVDNFVGNMFTNTLTHLLVRIFSDGSFFDKLLN